MPVVVAQAIYLGISALGTYAIPTLVAIGGAAGVTALSYAIVVGAYYAYGTYQARQARDKARSAFNDSLKDRLVMTTTTDAPRSRCYGRVRNVDGIVFKNSHGTKKEYYSFATEHDGDG